MDRQKSRQMGPLALVLDGTTTRFLAREPPGGA